VQHALDNANDGRRISVRLADPDTKFLDIASECEFHVGFGTIDLVHFKLVLTETRVLVSKVDNSTCELSRTRAPRAQAEVG
jgi:hypothetical protein